MTRLAFSRVEHKEDAKSAMYPSPANLGEFISLLLWEKEIEAFIGKLTGQSNEGETVTLEVCNCRNQWREGARDAKTLCACALYEGLTKTGQIREKLRDARTPPSRLQRESTRTSL
jgi:ADP-sugar diphosphatase